MIKCLSSSLQCIASAYVIVYYRIFYLGEGFSNVVKGLLSFSNKFFFTFKIQYNPHKNLTVDY